MFNKNAIEVAECIGDQYVFPSDMKALKKAAAITGFASVLILPLTAFAESGDAFYKITSAAYKIADYAVVLVIIFAGAALMFDNRPRAMKTLLGAGGGYILLRNAENIRDFLKSLTEAGAY